MNLNEYLDSVKAENHGYYFIVTCPECGHKEAYIYAADIEKQKKDPKYKIPIRCNRLNKCGKTSYIEEEITIDEKALKRAAEAEKIKISEEGISILESLCNMGDLLPGFDFDIRGIKNKQLKKYGIVYLKQGWASFIKGKKSKFDKKYYSENYENRDILIPIYNLEGRLERILLRSTKPGLPKKEIQVKLRKDAGEVWNVSDLINQDKKIVFLTEGVYDALSFAEVAGKYEREVGIVSIPGVKKYRKIIEVIKENRDLCNDKTYVIAFDSDEGGMKRLNLMKKEFEKLHIKYRVFDLKGNKDANDFLQNKRMLFSHRTKKLIQDVIKNQ